MTDSTSKTKKPKTLNNFSVRQEITQINENNSLNLYSHDYIEIVYVVEGKGVHKILNQDVPCKKGDIYIVNANTPTVFILQKVNFYKLEGYGLTFTIYFKKILPNTVIPVFVTAFLQMDLLHHLLDLTETLS